MVPGSICLISLIGSLLLVGTTAYGFDFSDVRKLAQEKAQQSYQAPATVPKFLLDLNYSEYNGIQFRQEESLWRGGGSLFEVMMVPPGNVFQHRVRLHEIDQEGVHPISFDKTKFFYSENGLAKKIPADLGYAGFKLTYPFHRDDVQNQFLVFAGASYFRGVGRHTGFGLSARGVAVNTGLNSGEEIPAFTDFWLERPAGGSERMRVFALLDGPSLTGAYEFDVQPGDSTNIDVRATLFFRDDIEMLGLAPLTSMFYYGENTIRPAGEWRPQVHDSDGLLLHDRSSGEWLWRPLINPTALNINYLAVAELGGFGLLQRTGGFAEFQDTEARYDRRPSAWIEPRGAWGKGEVVLVEIPTSAEVYDNIVAFWKPSEQPRADGELTIEYTVSLGREGVTGQPSGRALRTFVGEGNRIGGGAVDGAFRVIVDFAGGELTDLKADAPVVSDVTSSDQVEVIEHFVEYNQPAGSWRLSMLVKPDPGAVLQLRGYLSVDGRPLTETWTYQLPPNTDVRKRDS